MRSFVTLAHSTAMDVSGEAPQRRGQSPVVTALGHVLWIGGPPGAGKSTVARRLARRHGLRLFSADTRTWVHRDRALAAGNAAASRWESLTPSERWEHSSLDEMFAMSLHQERGQMLVDDVRALPNAPLVVAEGSTVPAWVVASGLGSRSRTLWLLPTAAFQREQLAQRGMSGGPAALYRHLDEVITGEALEHGPRTLAVDGTRSIEQTVDVAELMFADALATGPVAQSPAERQGLLREMNQALASQVRGYYARPWAHGDAASRICDFVCECGERWCCEDVRLAVEEAVGPVRAPGHDFPSDVSGS